MKPKFSRIQLILTTLNLELQLRKNIKMEMQNYFLKRGIYEKQN